MTDLASLSRWRDRALELGADAATTLSADKIVAAEWVRMKCLFGCDEPGRRRTCPPHLPPVKTTTRLLAEFRRAILLRVGPIVGSERSDHEARRLNDTALALERELFLAGYQSTWTMGAGPCDLCDACAHGKECPTPEKARPSMEACGIDVFTSVRNAGWSIDVVRDEADEYSFFALVLVD
jgi:predicted metal-binding protein